MRLHPSGPRRAGSVESYLRQTRLLALLALVALAAGIVSDSTNGAFWSRHTLLANLAASLLIVMLSVAVVNEVIEMRRRQRWSILAQYILFELVRNARMIWSGVVEVAGLWPSQSGQRDAVEAGAEIVRDTPRLTAAVRDLISDTGRRTSLHEEVAFLAEHTDEVLGRWAGVMLNAEVYAEIVDRHVELAGDIAWISGLLDTSHPPDDIRRQKRARSSPAKRAVEIGTTAGSFGLDDLLDIHRSLLDGTSEERYAGVVRTDQNWIGGRGLSPADASFVPPPEDCVAALLDDLIGFVNLDDIPAIAQAAMAHAQFETIHPYGDGSGRAGRCLIHVVLRRRRLAPLFVPPISVVLAANSRRYIAGLVDFREGRIDDWIGVFADATTAAAEAAQRLWAQIDALLSELLERANAPRADSVARKIILGLPVQSVVSADTAASPYGVIPTAARAALNRLQATAVLTPTRVGRRRDREWISDELFQLLDAFEHDLGQPSEGGPPRPAPPPTRRPRHQKA